MTFVQLSAVCTKLMFQSVAFGVLQVNYNYQNTTRIDQIGSSVSRVSNIIEY